MKIKKNIVIKAFTLIELIVVLIIIAAVALFSLPKLHYLYARYIVDLHVREMQSILDFARSSAIHSGRSTVLCASLDRKHCNAQINRSWILFFLADKVDVVEQPSQLIKVYSSDYKGHWQFNRNFLIRFASNGKLSSQNGTLTYTFGKYTGKVILSKSGRIRREK
ncbi:MAG: GspH/FimT family protein [Pseudomonadota bacterium]